MFSGKLFVVEILFRVRIVEKVLVKACHLSGSGLLRGCPNPTPET